MIRLRTKEKVKRSAVKFFSHLTGIYLRRRRPFNRTKLPRETPSSKQLYMQTNGDTRCPTFSILGKIKTILIEPRVLSAGHLKIVLLIFIHTHAVHALL